MNNLSNISYDALHDGMSGALEQLGGATPIRKGWEDVTEWSVDNPPPKFAKNTQGLGVVWVLRNPKTGEFYKKASAYTTKADSDGVEELFRSGMVDSFGDLLEQYRQGKWLLSQEVVFMLEVFCYYGMKDERL